MDSFYVTIPSNDLKYSETNSLASFRVDTVEPLHVGDDYEVGLAEISYTSSWYNLTTDGYVGLSIGQEIHYHTVKAGRYADAYLLTNELINALEAIIYDFAIVDPDEEEDDDDSVEPENLVSSLKAPVDEEPVEVSPEELKALSDFTRNIRGALDFKINPKISFLGNVRKFEVQHGILQESQMKPSPFSDRKAIIYMSENLIEFLGLRKRDLGFRSIVDHRVNVISKTAKDVYVKLFPLEARETQENRPFDETGGIHSLFVYSDIIKHNLVGSSYSQLLRVVEIPSATAFGNQVKISYSKPFYSKINQSTITSIEISIKDDTSQDILFQFGRNYVTLHFRRIRNRYE